MGAPIFLGYDGFPLSGSLLLSTWSLPSCNFCLFMFLQPIRIKDLRKVDPLKACEYFNNCFKDPSTFTVVIVGNLDPTVALPLILQYLVS